MAKDQKDAGDRDEEEAAEERSEEEAGEEASKDEDSDGEAERANGEDAGDEEPAKSDEAAERVAKALGVSGEEEEDAAEAKEPEAPPNRAMRRREEALERRKKRRAKSEAKKASSPDDDEELPKDRNARAKALLQKRRASAQQDKTPINLLPAEMVDDALSRGAAAAGKWLRQNFSVIQWVVVAAVVGGVGFLVYNHFTTKRAAEASDELYAGVNDERGHILTDDKRSDEEKEMDPAPVFKSVQEREDTALASYKKAEAEHGGTGAAILAKLGEAGVLLDKRDYPAALAAYQEVLESPLAAADLDVKGRAIEGVGLAKEGKGDIDGALSSFRDLQGVDIKGMKELGEFHEARLLVQKGDKDKAKELLKKAHEALVPAKNEGHEYRFLPQMVDEALRAIDPSALPPKTTLGGAKGGLSPEDLERMKAKLREMQEKHKERGDLH